MANRILWEIASQKLKAFGFKVEYHYGELHVRFGNGLFPARMKVINGRVSEKTMLSLIRKKEREDAPS